MPIIRSSADLKTKYNEISSICHANHEPVFITKGGRGDLAVMSIETYEMISGKLELYHLLDEGRAAVKAGKKRPLQMVMEDIYQDIENES